MAAAPTRLSRAGRPRVVTLVDLLGRQGGAEQIAMIIATHLDPTRFESILSVSRWPPPEGDAHAPLSRQARAELSATQVRFLPLRRRYKVDILAWGRLERFLRREEVAVLHTHKFGSNVWGAVVGRMARVPVIVAHEHTWSFQGQRLRRFLDRRLIAQLADRFVAVSAEDQRRMIEIEHVDRDRTHLIPNGVPPLAPAQGFDVRTELGIASTAPVVVSVGLLRAQKAHHVLLRALSTLVHEWPALRVLIVGDGPEHARLQRLAGELGVHGAVRFLGLRSDIADVLHASDVAVSCSDFEGSPLSILEYMDAGLAVVATAVGGVPDLIESGVNGLLVAPGDPDALARAIGELLRDPARAREMGARGRARRASCFDVHTMVRRVEALYSELLRDRGWLLPDP